MKKKKKRGRGAALPPTLPGMNGKKRRNYVPSQPTKAGTSAAHFSR